MDKDTFSPFQFNENPDNYQTLSENTKNDQTISKNKEDPWFEMDEHGFTDLLYSVFNQQEQEQEQEQEKEKQVAQEISPVLTKQLNNNKNPSSFSITSWEILNSYSKGFKMPSPQEQNLNHEINEEEGGTKLSTEEILRIAGERFIQFSTNKFDGISMFIHPYSSSLSGFSMEETRDVELVNLLLSAAENVGSREFDLAIQLITRCRWMASNKGSPIQRLAFYFSEALQERVYRETNESRPQTRKLEERMKGLALGTNNTFLATHQELPFVQVMQLAGIQAIIDNVTTNGKKIHVIDLQIRSGIQWTAMMQGLVDRKINHLKITAVGTSDQRYVQETGTRLTSFASSLNLSFSFNIVYLSDMREFKEELLKIEKDETVVVYSYLMLRSMLSRPDCLENLMREITRCKPALMVVTEVEANHNSPTFVDRFIETLFYYSAFFDCLEDCMESDSQTRIMLEGAYSREGILNIVASEGEERITRNVKLDVWRAFLTRFGMSEIELSESSRYQACLVLKKFVHGNCCTLSYNENGLIVGWKGTPIHSLTVWKFS